MASSGDLIRYSSFSTTYTGGQLMDIDSGGNDEYHYYYVSSPSWWAQITIDKNLGSWGRSFDLTAKYWNGSSWVTAWTDSHSWGQLESGERSYYYYHNSTLGSTSGDVSTAVLWELIFHIPELYRKRFWLYVGGLGCVGESKYNALCKSSPTYIYSAGRLGSDSRHDNGTSNGETDALSRFSQIADRGTQIKATHEAKLVWARYC